MIQALIDTGITNDPELKKLFNMDHFSKVTEMDMIESNGGYKSRKLNKRKNRSGGKPRTPKANDQGPEQTNTTVATVGPNTTVATVGDEINIHSLESSSAAAAVKLQMNRDQQNYEARSGTLKDDLEAQLKELDDLVVKRKVDIKAKFDKDISNVYWEMGADLLFWIAGFALWYLLMNAPFMLALQVGEAGLGVKIFGPELVFIWDFVIVGGLLGGLIKRVGYGNLSLEKYNLQDQPSKRGWIMWALKGLLGEAMTSHPATHVLKLRQDQKQLPTELSIFQLDIFIKYQKEIEEKKKELRIAHKQDWQDSVKFLEGQTQHRIGTLADGKSELIHLAIKGDQVALLNQGSTMTFPSIKSSSTSIDEVVEEPSSKKQQNLLKDDEKKTNGGMKKISKKYLKKTRKSKY
jgi:hypothetical protein